MGLALVLVSAWAFSYPWSVPGEFGVLLLLLLLVLWLAFGVFWAVRLWRGTNRFRRWGRPALARIWASTLVLAFGVAIVGYDVSLRVRFELSEDELLQFAQSPSGERGLSVDRQVGLYHIVSYRQVEPGVVMLLTHNCRFLSRCGFAYAPHRPPRDVCSGSDIRQYKHFRGPWYEFSWSDSGSC